MKKFNFLLLPVVLVFVLPMQNLFASQKYKPFFSSNNGGSNMVVTGNEYTLDQQSKGYRDFNKDAIAGLYYLHARYYDPNTRQFLTKDPAGMKNLYGYCVKDPVNYADPKGLCPGFLKTMFKTIFCCTEADIGIGTQVEEHSLQLVPQTRNTDVIINLNNDAINNEYEERDSIELENVEDYIRDNPGAEQHQRQRSSIEDYREHLGNIGITVEGDEDPYERILEKNLVGLNTSRQDLESLQRRASTIQYQAKNIKGKTTNVVQISNSINSLINRVGKNITNIEMTLNSVDAAKGVISGIKNSGGVSYMSEEIINFSYFRVGELKNDIEDLKKEINSCYIQCRKLNGKMIQHQNPGKVIYRTIF